MTQIIEVIIAPNGEIKIETKGFSGSACRAASQTLERALGSRQGEQLTGEFYAQEVSRPQLPQRRPS